MLDMCLTMLLIAQNSHAISRVPDISIVTLLDAFPV